MKSFATTYGIAFAVLLALDFVWLTTAVGPIYKPAMGSLMRERPDLVVAGLFYALYTFGLVYIVLHPALSAATLNWGDLAVKSALFGLVAYATYNLTGLSVINGWSPKLTLIDMTWGLFVTLTTSLATAFLVKMIGR